MALPEFIYELSDWLPIIFCQWWRLYLLDITKYFDMYTGMDSSWLWQNWLDWLKCDHSFSCSVNIWRKVKGWRRCSYWYKHISQLWAPSKLIQKIWNIFLLTAYIAAPGLQLGRAILVL
jgi:hypothetical protein